MEKLKSLSDLKGKARKACPVKGKLGKVFAVALVALMAAFGIVNYDILNSNAAEVSSGWSAAYYTGSNNRYFKSVLIYSYSTSATTVSMSANTNMQIDGGKGVDATWYGWQTGGYTGTGSTQYKSSSISGRVSGRNWCPLVGTKSYSANRTCSASSYSISGLVKCTGKSSLKGWYNTSVTATVSIPVPARDRYTITYNANGGELGANTVSRCAQCGANHKAYGYNCALSSVKPTRQGYTFTGWNTAADGSGTSYAAGANYAANAGVTLYAQWEQGPTYVTFDADGGTVEGAATAQKTYIYDQTTNLDAPVPTKDRCEFLGWYAPNRDDDGESMVFDADGHPYNSKNGYWNRDSCDNQQKVTINDLNLCLATKKLGDCDDCSVKADVCTNCGKIYIRAVNSTCDNCSANVADPSQPYMMGYVSGDTFEGFPEYMNTTYGTPLNDTSPIQFVWHWYGGNVTMTAHWRDLETYSLVKKEDAENITISQFTADENGTYDYQDQLAHSEWFRILNLPKGAKYIVTEEGTPQYQPKYKKSLIEDQ